MVVTADLALILFILLFVTSLGVIAWLDARGK